MKKGFDRHSCDKAVACLKEKKLVDDRKFAENWVTSSACQKPGIPAHAQGALKRKGVDRQVAEEVLAHLTPDSSEYIGAFEKAFEKQLRKSGVTDEKIKIRLAAKGYPLSLINRYLEKNR
jgi:SOS response regulatory protein OraA/RecX